MKPDKTHHILNASSNLLGICFVLLTGLKLTRQDAQTYADEITLLASFLFLSSCILSYLSLRSEREHGIHERLADYFFLGGIFSLFIAVATFSLSGSLVN